MTRSLLLCLLSLGPTGAAFATGLLDPRFDADGVRVLDAVGNGFSLDRLQAGAIDADGRIVGAGRAFEAGLVVRLRSDGVLDSGFGNGGLVKVPPIDGFGRLDWEGVALRPDGRMLLAGTLTAVGQNEEIKRAYLCQLLPSGALDPAFGLAGCVQPGLWPDSNRDPVLDLALQPDGRAVVLATTDVDATPGNEYAVARFNADGSFDRCFGDQTCQIGGYVIDPEPDLPDFDVRALALAPDGRIVLAGSAGNQGTADMTVVRLLPTGVQDAAFGNGGHRFIGFNQGGNNFDRADAVAVQPNGRILVAGRVQSNTSLLVGVAALDATGSPVPAYGDNGKRIAFFNDVSEQHLATAMRLQDDGKLLVAGYTIEPLSTEFSDCGLLRLDADGDLDESFAFGGYQSLDAARGQAPALLDQCTALDARGGAIVLFGQTGVDVSTRDSLFMKLDQDGVFRDSFEAGG